MNPQPIRFDFTLKIALYLQNFFGLHRHQALEFAFFESNCGCYEYKFGGTIDGKFWNNDGRWYVAAYRTDMTKELETVVAVINHKLEVLKSKYDAGKLAWVFESDPEVLRDQARKELEGLR